MKRLLVVVAALFVSFCEAMVGHGDMFSDGRFRTGCNYWASHAGMYMWRNWDAAQVEKDVAALKAEGVDIMRVFPLWPDFQPLTALLGGRGDFIGMAQHDRPLANEAGVDEEMMRRFRFLCDVARKNDIKLVVGLLTGWMSGRFFAPPALESRNVITDPEAVMWEVRFVRHFVREMKDHPAIGAWDLGNECNCMGQVKTPAAAWNWLNSIAAAIRAEDASRPVVSGMHGCSTSVSRPWNLRHLGELTDVLTTHPYPLFTPECARDDFDTMRNACHPAAESLMYAGLSGRPCFVEEAGDLGRCTASPERSSGAMRAGMFTAWASGLSAYVWWCGFDQHHLDFPPYTWNAVERELGLLTADSRAKPLARTMGAFREFLKTFPFAELPPRRVDAICLVPELEDGWPCAFGAYLLARQAGFDISFVGAERKTLPDAGFYILPSGMECDPYTHGAWTRVLEKARDGATVMISKGNKTRYSGIREVTGNQIETFRVEPHSFDFSFGDGRVVHGADTTTTHISAVESTVLARTSAGEPVVTVAPFGKGKVVFVNFAIEINSVQSSDCFAGSKPNMLYLVYRAAAKEAGITRRITSDIPSIGFTEHETEEGRTIVVAVNYEPAPVKAPVVIRGAIGKVWRGKIADGLLEIPANNAAVFAIE